MGDVGGRTAKFAGKECHLHGSSAAEQDEEAKSAVGQVEELEWATHPVLELINGFEEIKVDGKGEKRFLTVVWSSGHR